MSKSGGISQPKICLNMIVKNEAHIVHEAIDAVAPYIDYWVIVDTGSDDGTQDVIRTRMGELGIPGEIHERPWRDFGHNRTEALQLAQGHADYIWVMDADDTIEGTLDLNGLVADCYFMRIECVTTFWRAQLFKSGLPWRYVGALHEQADCDDQYTWDRLEGDYKVMGRHLGSRSLDPMKHQRDRDFLVAQAERKPDDVSTAYHLAQTYECLEDFTNARIWWERCIDLGGNDEIVYCAMTRRAIAMANLGEPWIDVSDAYLRAWEFRPTRAEALFEIAFRYTRTRKFELGYLFGARAAQIPYPDGDTFFVVPDVYRWRAADEQAVCASWIGRQPEAMTIWRRLLTLNGIPDDDRQRMIGNRDLIAGQLVQSSTVYPPSRALRSSGRVDAELTVSLIAGSDVTVTEATLNSFLNCCTDYTRAGRFLIIDDGLCDPDRVALADRYPFVEFVVGANSDLDWIRRRIGGRYWLHLGQGWRFFTEEALLTRLIGVLEAEPGVSRVGVNLNGATHLSVDSPARTGVRTAACGGRYVVTESDSSGPFMVDLTRPERPVGATLDEVLCVYA